MVTGIETAGLVLAVLPLVISALESYQDGLQTIKRLYRSEAQLRKLIRTLKVQRSKYRSNLEKLIKAAAPDNGIQDVPEDFCDPIWHGELNDRAKAYLGDRYESFQVVVEEYQECIREIAKKLRHINRPQTVSSFPFGSLRKRLISQIQAGKADLQALLVGNPRMNGTFTWLKKVDFTMKDKDLRSLTDQLDRSNWTLSGFINDSDMLERLSSKPTNGSRAHMMSETMRRTRLQADILYTAICNARLPDCHASHRVMLHLEDRLPPKGDLPPWQPVTADRKVSFCLSIAWQPRDPACGSCWHQTAVTASQTRSAHHIHVDDICRLVDQAQQDNHKINFHLCDDILLRFHNPKERVQPAVREIETVTLQELLQSQTRLQPKDSTTLALKLASSLLQLTFTSWLEKHWTKSNISFFRLTGSTVGYASQPLLEQVFQHRNVSNTPMAPTTPKVILFEFGILLMEIWTQVSFEGWMTTNQETCPDDSYYARLPLAMKWLDGENQNGTFPLEYRKAISRCLGSGTSFAEYNMSWDDQMFREAVCLNIIEPLQQTCIWS